MSASHIGFPLSEAGDVNSYCDICGLEGSINAVSVCVACENVRCAKCSTRCCVASGVLPQTVLAPRVITSGPDQPSNTAVNIDQDSCLNLAST